MAAVHCILNHSYVQPVITIYSASMTGVPVHKSLSHKSQTPIPSYLCQVVLLNWSPSTPVIDPKFNTGRKSPSLFFF